MRTSFQRAATGTPWIEQDPAEHLDYTLDWSSLIGDDAIESSAWSAGAAVETHTPSVEGARSTVWLSITGDVGAVADVRNTITTAAGRTFRRSFRVVVRER